MKTYRGVGVELYAPVRISLNDLRRTLKEMRCVAPRRGTFTTVHRHKYRNTLNGAHENAALSITTTMTDSESPWWMTQTVDA